MFYAKIGILHQKLRPIRAFLRFYRPFLMYFLEKSHDRFCPTHFKSMYVKALPHLDLNYITSFHTAKGIEFFQNICYNIIEF